MALYRLYLRYSFGKYEFQLDEKQRNIKTFLRFYKLSIKFNILSNGVIYPKITENLIEALNVHTIS